jgi:hypothetical protein
MRSQHRRWPRGRGAGHRRRRQQRRLHAGGWNVCGVLAGVPASAAECRALRKHGPPLLSSGGGRSKRRGWWRRRYRCATARLRRTGGPGRHARVSRRFRSGPLASEGPRRKRSSPIPKRRRWRQGSYRRLPCSKSRRKPRSSMSGRSGIRSRNRCSAHRRHRWTRSCCLHWSRRRSSRCSGCCRNQNSHPHPD